MVQIRHNVLAYPPNPPDFWKPISFFSQSIPAPVPALGIFIVDAARPKFASKGERQHTRLIFDDLSKSFDGHDHDDSGNSVNGHDHDDKGGQSVETWSAAGPPTVLQALLKLRKDRRRKRSSCILPSRRVGQQKHTLCITTPLHNTVHWWPLHTSQTWRPRQLTRATAWASGRFGSVLALLVGNPGRAKQTKQCQADHNWVRRDVPTCHAPHLLPHQVQASRE